MWLSKDEYLEMKERIDKLEREVEMRPGDTRARLEKLESELNETEEEKTSGWYVYTFFSGQTKNKIADRIKRLEGRYDQLRKDFDLLTQHLKVCKTTTSEVTRFSPCKKRK